MKGCFLLSLMCLITGAHASCTDQWGYCSWAMANGGCYGPHLLNNEYTWEYAPYMKTSCQGSCPEFCPKNCEWGSWTEGACDKTCGGGRREITRTKQVQESNGGYCYGPSSKTESCNNQKCPVCECKDVMNPKGGWGNCRKSWKNMGLICYVKDEENSGCKDKKASGSFAPNYYSGEACKNHG